MKKSQQITIAVQIAAGLYALHKGEALAVFLAATSAVGTYVAWQESEEAQTRPNDSVVAYLEKIRKGLI